jgi:hypothetical protein
MKTMSDREIEEFTSKSECTWPSISTESNAPVTGEDKGVAQW